MKKFGADFVVILKESKPLLRESMEPGKVYVQITNVEPYEEEEEEEEEDGLQNEEEEEEEEEDDDANNEVDVDDENVDDVVEEEEHFLDVTLRPRKEASSASASAATSASVASAAASNSASASSCCKSEFERNYGVNQFFYSTPFTPDGRKAIGETSNTFLRKTILKTEKSFPYILRRIRVVER